ncbi:MAG: helix-turn-helix transcriptional regulator [Ruminococcaceae bacterium]|nr:helix-turn-helix transcriptional regulator [Oscillospiraceae bacterium]
MEKDNYKYYQRIKDLREDSDLKQETVAGLLDMFQSSYQRYESGKLELPMHCFIKLAKFYNVSLDYLAGLTNDKEKKW